MHFHAKKLFLSLTEPMHQYRTTQTDQDTRPNANIFFSTTSNHAPPNQLFAKLCIKRLRNNPHALQCDELYPTAQNMTKLNANARLECCFTHKKVYDHPHHPKPTARGGFWHQSIKQNILYWARPKFTDNGEHTFLKLQAPTPHHPKPTARGRFGIFHSTKKKTMRFFFLQLYIKNTVPKNVSDPSDWIRKKRGEGVDDLDDDFREDYFNPARTGKGSQGDKPSSAPWAACAQHFWWH